MLPASRAEIGRALLVVHGTVGIGPGADAPEREKDAFRQRLSETAAILAAEGWTVGMIRTAARKLALSPELADKVRYGRPIAASDFERVRLDGADERTENAGMDNERIVTTRSGFALKVARAKLYTAAEARALWQAAGERGLMCEPIPRDDVPPEAHGQARQVSETAMFRAVTLPSGERRFRLL